MTSVLSITPNDLDRLTADGAVQVLAQLLWATASRLGIPRSAISIPFEINVPDAGVDAAISTDVSIPMSSLIRAGHNSYQVKTGKTPIQGEASYKELLCSKAGPLKPRVERCLRAGGVFSVVYFGRDVIDIEAAEKSLAAYITRNYPQYADPQIQVLGQNELIGLIEQFPSVIRRVSRLEVLGIPLAEWTLNARMNVPFVDNEEQRGVIDKIEQLLLQQEEVAIRVCGSPGSGKTRTVLEALRTQDYASLVLYFASSDDLNQQFINVLRLDPSLALILVVDECDFRKFETLREDLQHTSNRIHLICIDTGSLDSSPEFGVQVHRLDDKAIEAILRTYIPDPLPVFEYVRLCSGSPRAAHILGAQIAKGETNPLKTPTWEDYVDGALPATADKSKYWCVLKWVSLFGRVGREGEHREEFAVVADLIEADSGIRHSQSRGILVELAAQKLLQGKYSFYVTPEVVQIFLWKKWWEEHTEDDLKRILERLLSSGELYRSLLSRLAYTFKYSTQSNQAKQAIEAVLVDPANPLKIELTTHAGAQFLYHLAVPAPELVLNILEQTLVDETEISLQQKNALFYIVKALERVCNREAHFKRGATLLVQLSRQPGSDTATDAAKTLASLFSPGFYQMSATAAPPSYRLEFLRTLLQSSDPRFNELGLTATASALDFDRVMLVDSDYNAVTVEREEWRPSSWNEVFAYLQGAWDLLAQQLETDPKRMLNVLSKAFGKLFRFDGLQLWLLDSIRLLSQKPPFEKDEFVGQLSHQLRFRNDLTEEVAIALQKLYDDLVGQSFHDKLYRYVANSQFGDMDDTGDTPQIAVLAQEIIGNPALLIPELEWLSTEKARLSQVLGLRLGEFDGELALLEPLLKVLWDQPNKRNISLWSGYLSVLSESNNSRWASIVRDLAADARTTSYVPEIVWRGKADDELATLILSLWADGAIGSASLQLFIYGAVVRKFSLETVSIWVQALLDSDLDSDYFVALDLFDSYFEPDSSLPLDLAERLLMSPKRDSHEKPGTMMAEYHWKHMAEAYIANPASDKSRFLQMLLDRKSAKSFSFNYREADSEVLYELCKQNPTVFWKSFSTALARAAERNADWGLTDWLRDSSPHPSSHSGVSALDLLPIEDVTEWIDQDAETRAPLIAAAVGANFDAREPSPFLVPLLNRYSGIANVRDYLLMNLRHDGWIGPASLHYQAKIDRIEAFRAQNTSADVRSWCDAAIRDLESARDSATDREENRGW